MTGRRWPIAVGAVWIAVTLLAALSPMPSLRVAALVVYLICLPVTAAYLVQTRLFGRRSTPDLVIGVSGALFFLLLLACGAVFLGLHMGLHRASVVIVLGVVSGGLIGLAWFVKGGQPVPLFPPRPSPADDEPAERSPRSCGRVAAYGITAVCVAAAAVLSVVSQRHNDSRDAFTALSIEQTAAGSGDRSYKVEIQSHEPTAKNYVLAIAIVTQPTQSVPVRLHPGQTWDTTISAPADASINCTLALQTAPQTAYREVRIQH